MVRVNPHTTEDLSRKTFNEKPRSAQNEFCSASSASSALIVVMLFFE